jgi:hypothetical protein
MNTTNPTGEPPVLGLVRWVESIDFLLRIASTPAAPNPHTRPRRQIRDNYAFEAGKSREK